MIAIREVARPVVRPLIDAAPGDALAAAFAIGVLDRRIRIQVGVIPLEICVLREVPIRTGQGPTPFSVGTRHGELCGVAVGKYASVGMLWG